MHLVRLYEYKGQIYIYIYIYFFFFFSFHFLLYGKPNKGKRNTSFIFLFPFSPYFQTCTRELISFLFFLISLLLFISFLSTSLIWNQTKRKWLLDIIVERLHSLSQIQWFWYVWSKRYCAITHANPHETILQDSSLVHQKRQSCVATPNVILSLASSQALFHSLSWTWTPSPQ